VIRPSLRLRASMCLGAAAAIVLAGCSGSPSPKATSPVTSPVSAATMAKTFAPYSAAGQLTAHTSSRATGSCWTSSIALSDPNAFRCISNNQILDPCFAPPHVTAPTTVACFSDPWTPGLLLTLSEKLPAPDPGTRTTPWALELADGTRCVALTGTVDQVGTLDMGYSCGGTAQAGLVASSGAGTAQSVELRTSGSAPLHAEAVRTTWL
jgi:hypothetical protein